MKKSRTKKTIFQIAFLAALMFVTYYLIMRDKDVGQVWQVLVNSSKIWLIVSIASMTLYIFCGGWAIRVLMKGRNQKVSIWQCFKYSFIEFYFSAITPSSSGGQPVQLIYMGKDDFSVSDSGVVLVAITVLYKVSFLIITAIFFIITWGYISVPMFDNKLVLSLAIIGLVLNLGLIGILLILLFSKRLLEFLMKIVVKILGKLHIVKNVPEKIERYKETVERYHNCANFFMQHKGLVVKAFGVLTIQRMALLIIPFFVYKSFGLSGYSFVQIIATQCLLNLCADMMPLPGAVGINETIFLTLFTPIFLEQNITTALLLSRGISFYVMVIVAGVVVCGIQLVGIFRVKRAKSRETKLEAGNEE